MRDPSLIFPQLPQILLRRWRLMLLMMLVPLVATTVVTYWLPVNYTATATLLIDFEVPTDSDSKSPFQPDYMPTQIGIIQSHHVALRVVDTMKLADNADWQAQFIDNTGGQGDIRHWLADKLLENLEVLINKSRLVTISYTGTDPQYAADVTNAFALAYEKTNIELNVDPARKTAEQSNTLLADLRAKLDQAQRNLSRYQREKNIFAIDERLDIETARLTELSNRLVAAQGDRQALETQVQQIRDLQQAGRSLDTLPQVLSNSLTQDLKTKLAQKQTELAQISYRMRKRHPQYQSLLAEEQALRSALKRETETVVTGLKNQVEQARSLEQAFMNAVDDQKTKVMELKEVRDRVPALIREVESTQSNYQNALAQYYQFTVQSRLYQTNVTILNPAQAPMTPSFPNWKMNIALSIILGVIVAIFTVLMLELYGVTALKLPQLPRPLDFKALQREADYDFIAQTLRHSGRED